MSPPVQRPGDRKRFWFSLFYTTTQVFALINVLVYWAVLVPHGQGHFSSLAEPSHLRLVDTGRSPYTRNSGRSRLTRSLVGQSKVFDKSWFKTFWIFNLWGVTVSVVFIEVMFLNNVKRQVVRPSTSLRTQTRVAKLTQVHI
jgi:hypothetical protein